jgi:hypothetical protein
MFANALSISGAMSIMLPAAASGIMAYILYFITKVIVNRAPRSQRLVSNILGEEKAGDVVSFGSKEHKIRMAFIKFGLDVSGWEETAILGGRIVMGVLVAVVITFIGLPPLVAVVGAGSGVIIMNGLIDGAWSKVRMSVEGEIPLFLTGLASTIQVTPNVLAAVEDESNSLDPEGSLKPWLRTRFLKEGQAHGPAAIEGLVKEAFGLSESLGIVTFLVGRMWRTGGSEWINAFDQASRNIENVLDARINAQAAGDTAKGSVKVVAAMNIVVIVMMVRNPNFAESLANPLVQIIYAAAALMMIFGWFFINKMVDEAF